MMCGPLDLLALASDYLESSTKHCDSQKNVRVFAQNQMMKDDQTGEIASSKQQCRRPLMFAVNCWVRLCGASRPWRGGRVTQQLGKRQPRTLQAGCFFRCFGTWKCRLNIGSWMIPGIYLDKLDKILFLYRIDSISFTAGTSARRVRSESWISCGWRVALSTESLDPTLAIGLLMSVWFRGTPSWLANDQVGAAWPGLPGLTIQRRRSADLLKCFWCNL